ncbi:MAG: relaxase/mobilization nuclease domain-containing protein, partial [Candidatus Eremiobacteraeota bacterium]|nr:relaxase/mobilization nuclease domain-containing protein [Candidatus Eremiobacteraeota bacterium]
MLAKVPTKRLDGKSSFVALTQYIASQAAALTHSEQIWDIEAVAQEMEHIASLNERVKDAVYHYVLSWPSGEDPTDQQAFDSVTATLTALNMRDHQWVAALHRNTGHVHTHVEVNRINPETLKSIYPKGDWLVLDQTCRKLELKYGWSHDRGPHSVEMGRNNTPRIARNQPDLNDDAKAARTTGARDFSSWNGRESFQEWVGKEPAQQLKRVVEKPGAKWQHVHDVLGTFNLEYRTKGSGAVVVDRDSPEKLHAKASHVGRFATLQRLEEHLGVFDSPQREPVRDRTNEQASTLEPKAKSYGNETERSASSAGQRQVCRETLYERY